MKKIVSLVAMAIMIVGLTACIDQQDGGMQKLSSPVSSIQL